MSEIQKPKQLEDVVTIHYSNKCSSWGASWSRFLLLKGNLSNSFPGIKIKKDDSHEIQGSFDVLIGNEIVYSKKLQNNRYPEIEDIEKILLEKGFIHKSKK
jgi:selT/selW/selH-like putative selenoprotein